MEDDFPDPEWQTLKSDLAGRICAVHPASTAKTEAAPGPCLGFRFRTFHKYETAPPCRLESILSFIKLTGVDPHWLLTGDGDQFRDRGQSP